MQESEEGGREPDHGEGTQVPLAPRQPMVKSRAVGHVSASTKHAKSLCVQTGVASRSVLTLNFSVAEETFWWRVEGRKDSSPVWLVLPL